MKLLIDSSTHIFSLGVPRGTSPTEILSFSDHIPRKPNIRHRVLSDRSFDESEMVCAEIELGPEEKILFVEIENAATSLGWSVADSRETAAFIFQIPRGFANTMPESLLSDFSRGKPQTALRFMRKGWDHQATFDLTIHTENGLRGQHHVLLIRKQLE